MEGIDMGKTFRYTDIKTVHDAFEHLGLDAIEFDQKFENVPDHVRSYMKLEIITRALNDGWEPPLDCETLSYYNYVYLLTDAEAERWWWDDNHIQIHYQRPDGSCGLACAYSYDAWSPSHAGLGSRLAYKSRELASYSLKTFSRLWESFWFPQSWHMEMKNGKETW